MAWQTHAATNDEMINQLISLKVIKSKEISDSFFQVDRKLFLPSELHEEAYFDQPLKHLSYHQSAVHIYVMCLEHLELKRGNSFLNLGSGTGYLSSLAAIQCGWGSVHHGIETDKNLVKFSNESFEKVSEGKKRLFAEVEFFEGDVFGLDASKCMHYDKIYIGAACPISRVKEILNLLAIGGVLVAPIGDLLIKVTRNDPSTATDTKNFKPFSEKQISCVHFSSLSRPLKIKRFGLPKVHWTPRTHEFFPTQFKKSATTLFWCCNKCSDQMKEPIAEMLCRLYNLGLLNEIMTFTDRDWFLPENYYLDNGRDLSNLSLGTNFISPTFPIGALLLFRQRQMGL
mmetsp:Transcript_15719/g.23403  ORF Transcript_15719/g.23403 Transcript_15719/m.23403 type:complete len:342 (-) Transcript_15719:240-1265(-)